MKNILAVLVCLQFCAGIFAQEKGGKEGRYLEDQFYMGLGFNFLLEKPTNVVQRNLSYNLQAGFIKDIPLNEKRNFGVGLGLGYAANSYYSNIEAKKNGDKITYEITSDPDLKRSKFGTHAVEVPFEIRWRTSTLEEYKFWRVYAGAKMGYVFSGRSKLVNEDTMLKFANKDIQKFQYGLTLSFGYNTWNINAYYSLNPILENGINLESGEAINIRPLRIGVIFYIL